ncbi:hypothetical protein GDO81_025735, partial [Engystomops pustulosus]
VCGALHHVIDKNPFGLQVLVDQWPDFTSVICRPPLEDMKDPEDPYTNTYFLFSKDPQGLRHFLQDPQTVNWKQQLQIQGDYAAGKISTDLQYTSLQPHEASYVNDQWILGRNEHSLRFVERCIQTFPSISVWKKGVDRPIAWGVTDHSVEIRMGYTLPAYRKLGLSSTILQKFAETHQKRGYPIYGHTAPDNKASQAALSKAGYHQRGRWILWNCHSQKGFKA